ncbi:hypothetical protein RKD40_000585 [Streptomyces ambofaciens]
MTPRHQRPLARRKLLVALGGAVVAAPVAAAVAPHALAGVGSDDSAPKAEASGALPLTIVNETGSFGNADVHVYIVGNVDGRQVRVTPDGTVAPVSLSDNGADGYTDYAIGLTGGDETRLSLPYLSGRIYVSLGEKLKFKVVADGAGNAALQYPAGWVESDPNYGVLHDCAEFTYNSAGMFCNTTMVDMFSVPLAIRLTGADDQTTGTVRPGGRAAVFEAVRKVEEFAPLVVDDTRVIAPGHGLDAGLFPEDYLAPYIDEVWSTYTGRDLRITTNAGTFTGRVRGDRLTFDGARPGVLRQAVHPGRALLRRQPRRPQRRHDRPRRRGPRRRVQPLHAGRLGRPAHDRSRGVLRHRADQPLREGGARGHRGRQGVRLRLRRRGRLRLLHPGHGAHGFAADAGRLLGPVRGRPPAAAPHAGGAAA